MRVLQLLHMDNRMNILQAMQESSPEVRDVWVSAALVHPGPTSFARTLPVISAEPNDVRRAVDMRADEASKRAAGWASHNF